MVMSYRKSIAQSQPKSAFRRSFFAFFTEIEKLGEDQGAMQALVSGAGR
jgi:hypothetical protein